VTPGEQLELLFDMLAAHLRVADGRLNGWHPPFGNMPQVIGHLFQAPACCPRSVRKIVTQIMKVDVGDELCLGEMRSGFEVLPPLMDAILGPAPSINFSSAHVLLRALTGEDIRAPFALLLLQVIIQRAARFID
jgi:hypothetical protein